MTKHEGFIRLVAARLLRQYPQFRNQEEDIMQEFRLVAEFGMGDYDGSSSELHWLGWKLRESFQRWLTGARVVRVPRAAAGGVVRVSIEPLTTDIGYHTELPDDTADVVRRAVDSLPEPLRTVVTLHGMQEISHADIAEQLGYSREGVRQMWLRAKRILAEQLPCTKD